MWNSVKFRLKNIYEKRACATQWLQKRGSSHYDIDILIPTKDIINITGDMMATLPDFSVFAEQIFCGCEECLGIITRRIVELIVRVASINRPSPFFQLLRSVLGADDGG